MDIASRLELLRTVQEIDHIAGEICALTRNYELEISPMARTLLLDLARACAREMLRRALPMEARHRVDELLQGMPGNDMDVQ